MGGWDEDMDDGAEEMAREHMEREKLEERLTNPHCICQSELTWDAGMRAWLCKAPNCSRKH